MKVAVLGMGGMGWGSAALLKTMPGVDEVIGMDIEGERVKAVREKLKIRATTNLREVLEDPQVRFVYIAARLDEWGS